MEPLGRDKRDFDRNDEARLRRVLEIATRLEADAVGDRQERKLILQKLNAIESAIGQQTKTIGILRTEIMSLADKIKELTAVEAAEGKILVDKIAELSAALEAAKAKIAELEPLAAESPALKMKVEELTAEIAAADEAANAIAAINPTPVADQIIQEVVANPNIPTPPVVDNAPPVSNDVVQDSTIVDAAVDALFSE